MGIPFLRIGGPRTGALTQKYACMKCDVRDPVGIFFFNRRASSVLFKP